MIAPDQFEFSDNPRRLGIPAYWQVALSALVVTLIVLIGLYWHTAVSMAQIWWRSETFAHGMLIAPIVIYMIWVKRHRFVDIRPQSRPVGVLALLPLLLIWLIGYAGDMLVVKHLALVSMIPVAVYSLLGPQVTRAALFPLAYLFFAVPAGHALVPYLQDLTAFITVKALQNLTTIPVYWEGRLLTIPKGVFEVAEACSGIRYLIASVALGCLYAYLNYQSHWRRAAFILFSILMPLVANGLRAFGVVLIGHFGSMELAAGVGHIIYGWVFFGVVVLIMFWVGSWWREPDEVTASPASTVGNGKPSGPVDTGPLLVTAVMVLLLAATGPVLKSWMSRDSADSVLPTADLLTPVLNDTWQGPLAVDNSWQPRISGADITVHQAYKNDDQQVELYIAYYRQQQQNSELISSDSTLYDNKRWFYVRDHPRTVQIGDSTVAVNESVMVSGSRRLIAWHWYWINGQVATSPLRTKLLEVWGRLIGKQQGSAMIALVTEYDELHDVGSEQRLRDVLTRLRSTILDNLNQNQSR